MAYGGNALSSFWSTMLGLRDQRLREHLAQQEMQQQQMSQLGKGIGSMFSALGSMGQRSRQDQIANQLMNEQMPIPRAQAVDTSIQESADASAAQMQGFHTGGQDELTMRMQMEEHRAAQMKAQAYRDQVNQARAQYDINQATDAWKQTDQKLDMAYKERTAYIKEDGLLDNAMAKAEDPVAYKSAVDRKIALNQAAMDRGLKGVQPIDPSVIPPFMTGDEKAAVAAQQQAMAEAQKQLQAAQSAPTSMWDGIRGAIGLSPDSNVMGIDVTFDKERAVKEAQSKFDQEQKTLSGMTGQTPAAATKAPIADEPAKPSNAPSQFPKGHKQYNAATGQTREWDGEKWTYTQ